MTLIRVYQRVLLQSTLLCRMPILSFTSTSTDRDSSDDENTFFGYETIKKTEKVEKVQGVFSNVASKYDVMNDVMSLGIHRLWKDKLINTLNPNERTKLLDCAGGTGDVAFRAIKYSNLLSAKAPQVTVCDLNEEMLNVGQQRAKEEGINANWVHGNAEDLPFPDGSFNAYTISYGIRNCTNIDKNSRGLAHFFKISHIGGTRASVVRWSAVPDYNPDKAVISWHNDSTAGRLADFNNARIPPQICSYPRENVSSLFVQVLKEAHRVLTPGGRFLCLEFGSDVTVPGLKSLYDFYTLQVIPVIGEVVAGDWKSYQYLAESMRKFPRQEEFAQMIREAGFKQVSFETLSLGVSAMHSAFKF